MTIFSVFETADRTTRIGGLRLKSRRISLCHCSHHSFWQAVLVKESGRYRGDVRYMVPTRSGRGISPGSLIGNHSNIFPNG